MSRIDDQRTELRPTRPTPPPHAHTLADKIRAVVSDDWQTVAQVIAGVGPNHPGTEASLRATLSNEVLGGRFEVRWHPDETLRGKNGCRLKQYRKRQAPPARV